MYYTHFGLSQPPFKITPNTDFFYGGGNRGAILDALIYAITQGEGIIKVTGEVGSGKTMLCRMLATRLPEQIETIFLANPSVSPEDVLYAIAFELQIPVPPGTSRLEVTHALHDFLLERHHQGKQVVLLVEEAQGMPLATLEEIRLLSNLETAHSKLLQIVLFGQPELNDNLGQANMRQLKERITHSFSLGPLSPSEIKDYLSFRLRAAGYHGPDLFNTAAIQYIARHSQGLTRRINIIADKTLLAAFSDSTHNIALKHVKAAVHDSDFSNHKRTFSWRRPALVLASLIVVAALGMALLPAYQDSNKARPYPTHPLAQPSLASQQTAQTSMTQPPAQGTKISKKPDSADILEARIAATKLWLDEQGQNTFSIQLTGSNNPQQLKSYLYEIGQAIGIDKVFVYRTKAHGKPSMTILYGSFDSRSEAQHALAKLPAQLKANRPILRSTKGIRAEISQSPSS